MQLNCSENIEWDTEQRETFCTFPDLLDMLILQFNIITTITISCACAKHCIVVYSFVAWMNSIPVRRNYTL